jgi:hypothetical protein
MASLMLGWSLRSTRPSPICPPTIDVHVLLRRQAEREGRPARTLGYRSPREFIARSTPEGLSGNQGGTTDDHIPHLPKPIISVEASSSLTTISRGRGRTSWSIPFSHLFDLPSLRV